MKDQPTWDIEWWNRPWQFTQPFQSGEGRENDAVESPGSDVPLATALSSHYGISVQAYQQLRSAKGVIAEDGSRYVWKPLKHRESVTKLAEIEWLVSRLHDGGVLAAGPIETGQHHLFCQVEEMRVGYLQPWLPGCHLDLGEREQRLSAISTVSRMHAITTVPDGPVTIDAAKPVWRRGPSLLFRRMFYKQQLLLRVWPQLLEQFPEWQNLSAAVFSGMARAIEAANQSRFAFKTSLSWCHRDLAPHNLLWDGKRVGMIDFDLAAIDDPLGDLLQICNHALYLGAVQNLSEWLELVQLYEESTAVSADDHGRLRGLLGFPETLVRAVTDWLHAGQPTEGRLLHHAVECEWKRQNWLHQLG